MEAFKGYQSPLNPDLFECGLPQIDGKNVKQSQSQGYIGNNINSLPADLLLHILSFMEMPDMAKTSLLSTKWRYLWMSISSLDFRKDWKLKVDKATFIDRLISNYRGSKIRELLIFFYYEASNTPLVNSWINFAMRNNVEKLILDFYNGECPEDKWSVTRYKLPQTLGNCSSITCLTLSFCNSNLSSPIHLSSLKILRLELLDLSSYSIICFTSGCPLLEDLTLNGCNRVSDLNIIIENKNLKSLSIEEYAKIAVSTELRISAPDLLSLKFSYGLPRANYHIKNLPSLKYAGFNEIDPDCSYDKKYHAKVPVGLIRDLHFVEQLELCRYVVGILSGRNIHTGDPLSLSATFLKIETNLKKKDIPGLFYLLQMSANLNDLAIQFTETEKRKMIHSDMIDGCAFIEEKLRKIEGNTSTYMLQSLKHLGIYFLSGIEQEYTVEEILQKLPTDKNYSRLLLKIAKELEVTNIRDVEKYGLDLEFLLKELTTKLSIFFRIGGYTRLT